MEPETGSPEPSMEARVAHLESEVTLRADVGDIKTDVRALRDKMDAMGDKLSDRMDAMNAKLSDVHRVGRRNPESRRARL
jgi:hypothetical protein